MSCLSPEHWSSDVQRILQRNHSLHVLATMCDTNTTRRATSPFLYIHASRQCPLAFCNFLMSTPRRFPEYRTCSVYKHDFALLKHKREKSFILLETGSSNTLKHTSWPGHIYFRASILLTTFTWKLFSLVVICQPIPEQCLSAGISPYLVAPLKFTPCPI